MQLLWWIAAAVVSLFLISHSVAGWMRYRDRKSYQRFLKKQRAHG
jgi:hypothetical protein